MGSLLYLPVIWLVATSWLFLLTSVLLPDSQASQNLKVHINTGAFKKYFKTIDVIILFFSGYFEIPKHFR